MSGLGAADASRFPVSRKSSRMAARPLAGGRAVPRLENAILDEQLDQLVDPPPVHEVRVARHRLPDRLACRQLPELHASRSLTLCGLSINIKYRHPLSRGRALDGRGTRSFRAREGYSIA